ncbi:AMP-binding protein [Neptunomonas sp.]|uniref:AMP-binding protein n=1 Tax=Neptunomonas sp. TaxID=1971898 RepID=UPI003561BDB2
MAEKTKQRLDCTIELSTETLLEQVRQLASELHSRRKNFQHITLDSALDRDLGFDSLSRVELFQRLERAFGVRLPEQMLASAETPRDLWRALVTAGATGRRGVSSPAKPTVELEEMEGTPHAAETLLEMLDWHVLSHPQRPHVYLYGDEDEPEVITYAMLADGARTLATGLQSRGLMPGQTVAIMLPTSRDYLFSFFGILLAGGIPVPIYPPLRPSQIEDHLRRHAGILANAEAVLLITVAEASKVARLLKAQVDTMHAVVTPEELMSSSGIYSELTPQPQDIAFLQYTSGSTGQPKGVILTHANLLANIRAMGEAVQVDSTDVFVSWLPLYHDMGLIGAWLGSLYYGMPLVLMSPLAFLIHPPRWLWMIHKHRGTLTAAPNFAYELCLNKIEESDLKGLDLSSLRRAFNGAEPVSPNTLRRFTEHFASYGFRARALAPVYGLAEAAVGLAFPPLDRGPLIDSIQREPFASSGKAIPALASNSNPLEFVACGQPLPGYQIRIVDMAGRELPDRQEGRLEFRGPSATSGYLRNADATQSLFDGEWLDSGDLAYIAEGDVYLTSRIKDLIIRGGRNIYPYEVEEAVGDIPGIRKGSVAIFGTPDPNSGTERLIVIAETREVEPDTLESLQRQVYSVATDLLNMPPDEAMLAPLHTVLKTSSGKIRRAAVRELYEQGRIGERPRAVWWQIIRLALSAWKPRMRSARRWLGDMTYAGYAKIIFWLLTPITWLLVVLLPGASLGWTVMRRSARLLFRLTRVPLRVEGLENWPDDQACVIVANHSSYLDGVVLAAALPTEFAFVAKAELDKQFFPRRFLRRIGTVFVERFDKQQGVADAQRTVNTIRSGRSLMFFPEGTLDRMPGLLPFHMGAFVAAAETGMPVVPVTIRGTRSILRSGSWFPRRGAVSITVSLPIMPTGTDWDAAVKLRNAARTNILQYLGEPDLEREAPHILKPS